MPFKGSKFQDRQESAAEARRALLEKFKARPAPDDPAVLKREAERRARLHRHAGHALDVGLEPHDRLGLREARARLARIAGNG